MSETEKWTLLNQYKGSTLELLVSNEEYYFIVMFCVNNVLFFFIFSQKNQSKPANKMARRSTSQKGAVDFVQSLKENRVNKNTMNRMKQTLKEKTSASKFVEAGGITALTQYLQNTSQKAK